MPDRPTIVFAAGGTGGHIFPLLAIEEALRADPATPDFHARYLCSTRPIDTRILHANAREDVIPIPAIPFSLAPRSFLRLAMGWGRSLRDSRAALRAESGERAALIITTGGFVAAPVAQAARVERIPLVLVNLDAVAGKASRFVGRRAALAITSADGPGVPASWQRIPPIVRANAIGADPAVARSRLGLPENTPILLITGGSQGARSLNLFLAELASNRPEMLRGYHLLHQAGDDDAQALESVYRAANLSATVVPFIENMGDAWSVASLCIGRCGAGAVAEAWANGVPCIFMPYPFHKDEHQRLNARPLEQAGAAIILKDHILPQKNLEAHAETIGSHLSDPTRIEAMRARYENMPRADGAQRAAGAVSGLLKNS
ncbi:MAG: UDP-N-acetylglucosamine--N-acetylmuramyl-(pentapeptide) pyrophosphoryl-undecaprenol N-acetylglucosamine transferase [Phycisphaeraceae bacterium]|nr:MAG: UDP-N-acetylglucosamine--N-acetylmuramyl-(pentapeptide) pyrophosphoryl-undecaprenol N-acetylglucosamine transferase [Phycisphaeraceae bacterium]